MELLKTYGSDPVLLFWKAYGIIMEDRTSEGIRELESIADHRDMVLCSSMLMIHAHKKCKTVGEVFVHTGIPMVTQIVKQFNSWKQAFDLTSCGEKARYYLSRHNFSHALDLLNQAVASYPGSVAALLDKMKVQLALQDWEQAVETAQRCLAMDQGGVEATSLLILELLAKEGSGEEAASRLADLLLLVDRLEPKNHALYYEMCLPYARLEAQNSDEDKDKLSKVTRTYQSERKAEPAGPSDMGATLTLETEQCTM